MVVGLVRIFSDVQSFAFPEVHLKMQDFFCQDLLDLDMSGCTFNEEACKKFKKITKLQKYISYSTKK